MNLLSIKCSDAHISGVPDKVSCHRGMFAEWKLMHNKLEAGWRWAFSGLHAADPDLWFTHFSLCWFHSAQRREAPVGLSFDLYLFHGGGTHIQSAPCLSLCIFRTDVALTCARFVFLLRLLSFDKSWWRKTERQKQWCWAVLSAAWTFELPSLQPISRIQQHYQCVCERACVWITAYLPHTHCLYSIRRLTLTQQRLEGVEVMCVLQQISTVGTNTAGCHRGTTSKRHTYLMSADGLFPSDAMCHLIMASVLLSSE